MHETFSKNSNNIWGTVCVPSKQSFVQYFMRFAVLGDGCDGSNIVSTHHVVDYLSISLAFEILLDSSLSQSVVSVHCKLNCCGCFQ